MRQRARELILANYQPVLLVFLAFLTMVLVSNIFVRGIVQTQTRSIGEEIMNTTEVTVSADLSEMELSFAGIAHTVEAMLAADDGNDEILAFLTDTNAWYVAENSTLPDFMKVYAFIGGEFLDGSGWVPPDGYVPQQRPWYIGAEGVPGEIFFSEPYQDADTGGLCISFSKVVGGGDGRDRDVLAIDLNLSRISDSVGNVKIAGNGYGVLISDQLIFMTHRDAGLIGTSMLENGAGYQELANLLREGQPISAYRFRDLDGADSIAFFRTVFTGWHIGVFTPRESYFQQANTLAWMMSILGFALMVALSTLLVRTRIRAARADEESMRKSVFLTNTSHEMRTPLNAILGMTEIAQRADDLGTIRQALAKIRAASNHLLGVISDILDTSRIEADTMRLREEDFLLEDMLSQAITVLDWKMQEKKQEFHLDVSPDTPPVVRADRQRLAQVLVNLLSNANKFTPAGGSIDLRVGVERESESGATLLFEVIDSGIGISPEQQKKLFHSFTQASDDVSRRFGGTGLGLFIARRLVDLMGGEIGVESQEGKGSRFYFTVDVGISGRIEEQRGEDEGIEGIFAGRRILLVEDVEINREIVIALLEETGVRIDCAENGIEACAILREEVTSYDLIFMDILMPGIDGLETTRRIRAMKEPWAQRVPIVAMTANVFKEDIENCLAAGMNGHLGKPLDLDEVIAVMRSAFAASRAPGAQG